MSESFFNGFLIGMVFGAFLATVCWDSFTRKVRTIMEPDSEVDWKEVASAKKCPTCKGTGELKDAVQAWDVSGAPIPKCGRCKGTGRRLTDSKPPKEEGHHD